MFRRRSPNGETAQTGRTQAPQTVQCPLCGARFDRAQSMACAHCPRPFRSCGMVVCPRCSHEFPVI
ncbi:MAG TPA: hypothetical protein VMV03_04310 [Spirochaetia bacterium]|nr:hypothetical protein [Spirochaetia bacterium]